jgi:hypothetical protein
LLWKNWRFQGANLQQDSHAHSFNTERTHVSFNTERTHAPLMPLARTPDSPFFLWKQSSWYHLSLTDTSACYHHLVVSSTTLYRNTVVLIYAIITEESGHFGTPAFQISVRDQRRWEHYKSSQNGWQFMLPKRRFWKDEQKMKCGFSIEFSTVLSPNRVLMTLKSASKIRMLSFVHPSKIFVWEGYNWVTAFTAFTAFHVDSTILYSPNEDLEGRTNMTECVSRWRGSTFQRFVAQIRCCSTCHFYYLFISYPNHCFSCYLLTLSTFSRVLYRPRAWKCDFFCSTQMALNVKMI